MKPKRTRRPKRRHVPKRRHRAPLVLTVDEVAELLRCDRKTVYSMIEQGKLPGVRKVGRSIRIAREPLLAWLRQDAPSQGTP